MEPFEFIYQSGGNKIVNIGFSIQINLADGKRNLMSAAIICVA